MFAAVAAISAIPPAAAWHALSAGGDGGGSALGRLLAWVEEWSAEAHGRDPDEAVRGLALRVAGSAADLQQRALALGGAGGGGIGGAGRDDAMYLLKNISNLAIGGM